MKQAFTSHHWVDSQGNPEGGTSYGVGFAIAWQRGPLKQNGVAVAPTGAFVETILDVVIDRLNEYQRGKFNCEENAEALQYVHAALAALNSRTQRREAEGVEGTYGLDKKGTDPSLSTEAST